MRRIALCTPRRPLIDPDHNDAVSLTLSRLKDLDYDPIVFATRGSSLLEHARSTIATGAYEWGAEVLLWVDDDIVFQPDDAVRLIETVLKTTEVDVVGAVCSTKKPGAPINAGLDATHAVFYAGGSLMKVKGHIGLGMTAHARRVYSALTDILPRVVLNNEGLVGWPFFRSAFARSPEADKPMSWLGEDVTFCQRVENLGFTLWADTRVRAVHRGEYDYRIEDCFFKVQDLETIKASFKEDQPSFLSAQFADDEPLE